MHEAKRGEWSIVFAAGLLALVGGIAMHRYTRLTVEPRPAAPCWTRADAETHARRWCRPGDVMVETDPDYPYARYWRVLGDLTVERVPDPGPGDGGWEVVTLSTGRDGRYYTVLYLPDAEAGEIRAVCYGGDPAGAGDRALTIACSLLEDAEAGEVGRGRPGRFEAWLAGARAEAAARGLK